MKALDLFCGAGGAAKGMQRAGFHVTGIDISPQPRYCGDDFIQADALALPIDIAAFDFIWASPPCQAHSALRHLHPEKEYDCFIERIRDRLKRWGGPWLIENVPGAPLRDTLQLCGSSFGLKVRRHRLFESNLALTGSDCRHKEQGRPIDVSGTGGRRINRRPDDHGGNVNKPKNIREASLAMGIDWMTRKELSQAIPPAYSEFLGRQILAALKAANGLAEDGSKK